MNSVSIFNTLSNRYAYVRGVWCEKSALFYVGFALLYIKTMASETSLIALPGSIDALLMIASTFFFFLHCLKQRETYSNSVAILLLVILIFLCVNYTQTGLTSLLTSFFFIVASTYGVDRRRFVSVWFNVSLFVFVAMISIYLLLYICGSPLATSVVRTEDGGNVIRLSFFFNHPNGAANMAMMLTGAFLYLNSNYKLRFTHYAFVFICSLFILYTTDSRTSVLLTLSLIPLYLIYQNTNLYRLEAIRYAIGLLPILLFFVTYLLAGPFYSTKIASLLTGRIWLWHVAMTNLGITFFGNRFVPTIAPSYIYGWDAAANTLDSFYASGLFTLGLISSALFCWLVFRAVTFAEDDEMAFLPVLTVLLLHGFTESGVLMAAVSFPLVFLSIAFRTKNV